MIYEPTEKKLWIEICCATCMREKPIVEDGEDVSYCSRNKCKTCPGNCCVGWRPRRRIVVAIIKKHRNQAAKDGRAEDAQ